jgi:hypothetical protein
MSFEQRHRVQKHRDVTSSRLDSFRGKNHLKSRVYSCHTPVDIARWNADDRVAFDVAVANTFEPCNIGGT